MTSYLIIKKSFSFTCNELEFVEQLHIDSSKLQHKHVFSYISVVPAGHVLFAV